MVTEVLPLNTKKKSSKYATTATHLFTLFEKEKNRVEPQCAG